MPLTIGTGAEAVKDVEQFDGLTVGFRRLSRRRIA